MRGCFSVAARLLASQFLLLPREARAALADHAQHEIGAMLFKLRLEIAADIGLTIPERHAKRVAVMRVDRTMSAADVEQTLHPEAALRRRHQIGQDLLVPIFGLASAAGRCAIVVRQARPL